MLLRRTIGEANFDRIISVEMLEHMKNYEKLLGKVASVRCHRVVPEVRERRARLVAR
jgi:2-polyprenyl-3-methyl-5-hydroxy-6-metoxy-1,4-benzoquinol methylase